MTGAWLSGTRTTEVGSPNLPLPTLRPPPARFCLGAILLIFASSFFSIVIIVTIIMLFGLVGMQKDFFNALYLMD
jgi:hypothetical protein